MAYIEGHARDQALLLPASVEDYVSADNPVRFIDAFVEDLDLGEVAAIGQQRVFARSASLFGMWEGTIEQSAPRTISAHSYDDLRVSAKMIGFSSFPPEYRP